MHGAGPVRAQPYLGGGLLSGDVEHRAGRRDQCARLEQQRGLADAGLAGEQQDRAGDQAPAEDPVQFVKAGRAG